MKGHEEIRKLAFDLFEKSGRVHGREMEHWLEAERIIKARQMDKHAVDIEAAASKGHAHQRSDARWHEAKKTGTAKKAK